MKSFLKKQAAPSLLSLIFTKAASFIKIHYMIGTLYTFFSFSQIAIPVSGLYAGTFGSIVLFFIRACMLSPHHSLLWALTYHMPTTCAALYLGSNNRLFNSLLPLACIGAFIIHPVGGAVWYYAAFWLVPLLIALRDTTSIFAKSIGSTFAAHAVGSVIFLYTTTTTPSFWQGLLFLVPLERLCYGLGITVSIYALSHIKNILVQKASSPQQVQTHG